MGRRRSSRRAATLLGLVLAVAVGVSACDSGSPAPPEPSPTPSVKPAKLVLGVWGDPAETDAFRAAVEAYDKTATATSVSLKVWPTRRALLAAVREGGKDAPDVYLASRRDLGRIEDEQLNVPLLQLLDERGVDYGDGYSRDALLSFSADDELQCMPYGVSPMVLYLNTDLVDFQAMAQRQLPVPPYVLSDSTRRIGWNFEMFAAAADYASRPRRGSKGVYVPPNLRGLAPFVYSGAGQLFDDEDEPTSLDLSSDGAREALSQALTVLRDPLLTLSDEQLAKRGALGWFKRGKLGMIMGTRALTPQLRQVEGLDFDVMPMPILGDQVTIGDITGLCISSGSATPSRAADLLVGLISDEAVAGVARSGSLVPANLEVASSEAFLQPDQLPANANVFNTSVRELRVPDGVDPGSPLDQAVGPTVRMLFTTPVLDDLEALTTQIDEESRAVLDPDYVPSEGPSGTPTVSPPDSASPSASPTGLPSPSGLPSGPASSD